MAHDCNCVKYIICYKVINAMQKIKQRREIASKSWGVGYLEILNRVVKECFRLLLLVPTSGFRLLATLYSRVESCLVFSHHPLIFRTVSDNAPLLFTGFS